ncbi:hypothetical protein L1987_67226 [Smallanthus sonchifolius]|uniref:Uncharacterized protein n=1 Tax=Smallanthus sonchifolius TaxID=185202 RepID=A0ACB9BZC3_9ASTR|nr:hypothetical protein L1987_67226 [Smallanthus sonchifolius]
MSCAPYLTTNKKKRRLSAINFKSSNQIPSVTQITRSIGDGESELVNRSSKPSLIIEVVRDCYMLGNRLGSNVGLIRIEALDERIGGEGEKQVLIRKIVMVLIWHIWNLPNMEPNFSLEFYKDSLGLSTKCKVLCDISFLKWLSQQNSDYNALLELKNLLSVDNVMLKTTRCVNFEFDQWCQMRKRSDKSGYIKELPVVVCSHLQHLSSNICVKSLLQKTKYKRHLLGSVEQCFYEDSQKTIMDHKKIVEFYKDLHGVGEKINVLCDFSFLKWLCLHNHDPLPELKDLLSVNKVVLKTTRFENSLFHLCVTKEKLTLLPLKKSQKKQYLKWLKKEDSVVESSQVRGKKRKRSKPQGETF